MTAYFIASSLIGFKSDRLRVRMVREICSDQVEVVTADLLDSGTMLCLHPNQLAPEKSGMVDFGEAHRTGLLVMIG